MKKKLFGLIWLGAILAIYACDKKEDISDPMETKNMTVSYKYDLDTLLLAENFEYVDVAITAANFPIPPKKAGKVERVDAYLFDCGDLSQGYPGVSVVTGIITRAGYREATVFEPMAYAKANPTAQRMFAVTAPGSPLPGDSLSRLPILKPSAIGGRRLEMFAEEYPYCGKLYFLGVKKAGQ